MIALQQSFLKCFAYFQEKRQLYNSNKSFKTKVIIVLTFSCSGVNVAAILLLTDVITRNTAPHSNYTDTRLNLLDHARKICNSAITRSGKNVQNSYKGISGMMKFEYLQIYCVFPEFVSEIPNKNNLSLLK